LPKESTVERTTVIHAPNGKVFDYLNDLEKHQLWSSWKANDPTMHISYGEKRVGKGAQYSWTSKHSGEGSVTITESIPCSQIETALNFRKQGTGKGYYSLALLDGAVKVTEGFRISAGLHPVERYFGVYMKGIIAKHFNQDLSKLRAVIEQSA